MGGVSSLTRTDTLQYDSRAVGSDEPLDFELDNSHFSATQVTAERITAVPEALVLRNVLSNDECSSLLKAMFPNKRDPIDKHKAFPILFRDWEPDPEAEYKKLGVRIFTRSEQVASALYERVKAHLPALWSTPSPKGDATEHWRLHGLHQRLRFVCYGKGQRFPPHRDDPWVQSETQRSFLTFVLYLSHSGTDKLADFEGGEFAFVESLPQSTLVQDRAVVAPEPGLVVVFPHRELHESKALRKGLKFMLRSDVMYTFDHADKPSATTATTTTTTSSSSNSSAM